MDKHTPDLRMDAYYYGFGLTGIHAVDLILSAVACAGKAFHHTDCWFDESTPYDGHSGSTPVEWIQNAGNAAAEQFAKINAINAELLDVLMLVEERFGAHCADPLPLDLCELIVAALAKARGDAVRDPDDFVECQACYGKGFNDVERQVAERKSDVQTFRETCDACEGTGKVSAGGVA